MKKEGDNEKTYQGVKNSTIKTFQDIKNSTIIDDISHSTVVNGPNNTVSTNKNDIDYEELANELSKLYKAYEIKDENDKNGLDNIQKAQEFAENGQIEDLDARLKLFEPAIKNLILPLSLSVLGNYISSLIF